MNTIQMKNGLSLCLILAALHGCGSAETPSAPISILDTSFNGSGKLITAIKVDGPIRGQVAMAAQSDGKLLIAASYLNGISGTNIVLTRLNADGTTDTGFGTNGLTSTVVNLGKDNVSMVHPLANGKILVGGSTDDGLQKMLLLQYTSSGALDSSGFGSGNGYVTVIKSGAFSSVTSDADGNLFAAGSTYGSFVVAKYSSAGVIDGTFGTSGAADYALGDSTPGVYGWSGTLTAITRASDGKLTLSGNLSGDNANKTGLVTVAMNADGSAPASPMTTSLLATGNMHLDYVSVPGGKAWWLWYQTGTSNYSLMRHTAEGSVDTTYGSSGTVSLQLAGGKLAPHHVVPVGGDKTVLVGNFEAHIGIGRLDSSGANDTAFGLQAGYEKITCGNAETTGTMDKGWISQPDGKLVVYGTCEDRSAGYTTVFVSRYNN